MKTTVQSSSQTTQTKELKLINGDFSPVQAEEIVNELIAKKINFNTLKNFSSQVRFGHDDEYALQRVEELNEALETFHELLQDAKTQGKNLRIRSGISIDLV
ncbi:hypothetical protein QWY31_02945 [Cytophagales bacterium LB-30]|uniref:Uncharacterized protein n=1 Tax=Shiella aurantiaca TaxID=3058365 RepID=A0ABT8F2J3_9BACT|nr:hypothetical protein [Shiella aurantiaca]MDN4164439.1 hypothetical protein [Shiella aurantiaca]